MTDEYKAEIETKLPSVQTTLQDMCKLNFGPEATVPDVVLSDTVKFNVTGSKVCIAVVASTTVDLKTDAGLLKNFFFLFWNFIIFRYF